ncbi:hypothetical protein VOI36_27170 [Burkholderia sp. GS2Y]|uniref:Uncharacterized protein n=1 Tax=Burkholderia theae TaxID=3143496 RepID=A0ABU9WNE1_9BURK
MQQPIVQAELLTHFVGGYPYKQVDRLQIVAIAIAVSIFTQVFFS